MANLSNLSKFGADKETGYESVNLTDSEVEAFQNANYENIDKDFLRFK